jgi:hypothetical protein
MAASLDEGTVVRGDFAIAGSDAPALLDPVEEGLDQIARPVQIRLNKIGFLRFRLAIRE